MDQTRLHRSAATFPRVKKWLLVSLAEAHQPEGVGEALAHSHAFLLVDVQRIGFDSQVMLQGGFGVDQRLQGVLRLPQALLQGLDGVIHLIHLVDKAVGENQPIRLAEVTFPTVAIS